MLRSPSLPGVVRFQDLIEEGSSADIHMGHVIWHSDFPWSRKCKIFGNTIPSKKIKVPTVNSELVPSWWEVTLSCVECAEG